MNAVPATSFPASDPQGSNAERQSVQAGLDLARELRRRWEAGERPSAEELLRRRPDLLMNGEAALEVVYEEYCQREEAGDPGAEQDILERFPQWAGPLRIMIDCHRYLLLPQRRPFQFPDVGQSVGDFRLLEEIARGASGRVYLAEQAALAQRPVILKLTPLDGAEHLALARLQHTHIVPLYAALELHGQNLRVLCMPCFGRATLGSVLKELATVPPETRTGLRLVEAIDRSQGSASGTPLSGPRQMLSQATYVEAICWIAACLSDALQFAHDRSLLHLDLKPSNILLATDGQPMLLDFHLAREPCQPDGPPPENLGGTPGYMPPEQSAALTALRSGEKAPLPVDARADVYAIGAVLYESLGGRMPDGIAAPPLAVLNRAVSAGLSDVVARCLRPAADERYRSAAALADDLRRHLTHRPLCGVPNRSISERWQKWRRRHPGARRFGMLLILLLAALAIISVFTVKTATERYRQAQAALRDGQRQMGQEQYAEAVESFRRGSTFAAGLAFPSDLRLELDRQLEAARRLHLLQQTHEIAQEVRRLPGMGTPSGDHLASLAGKCRALWDRRQALIQNNEGAATLESDLKDIAMFAAVLCARNAGGSEAGAADAIRILDEAESTFGPSAVLEYERWKCRRALGLADSESPPPQRRPASIWEHRALGSAYLEADDLNRAADQLAIARDLDPANFWANYYYGLCAYRLGSSAEAVAAFSVCIGANPGFADCFYNRGLAYLAMGQRHEATRDFERAIALDPNHPARSVQVTGPRREGF
jgi:serine/threonine protein kinase